MSLVSFPSWGLSSQFVCNPWTMGDGSKSDSFIIKWDKDKISTEYKDYKLVHTDDDVYFIFVWDTLGNPYPQTMFVNRGLDKIHLFKTDYPSSTPPESVGKYDYFHFFGYTSCKEF